MSLIKRAWRGEEPLWKVFWLYGILFYLLANLLPIDRAVRQKGLMHPDLFIPNLVFSSSLPAFCLSSIIAAYFIWLYVSLWRTARNTEGKFWGVIVRIFVVLGILAPVAMSLMGFLGLGYEEPLNDRHASECIKMGRERAASAGRDISDYWWDHPVSDCIKEKERQEMESLSQTP